MVMAVVVTPRLCTQPRAVPCLVVLTTSPSVSENLGKRHTTVAMWAAQMIRLLHRWLPGRQICARGESASTVLE
jgi:hypothetical protein